MPKEAPVPGILIGQVAEASDEKTHTIRFWTKEGLLRTIGKNRAGYFLYEPNSPARAIEIRRLSKDHSLAEVKTLLDQADAS